jgi:ketosteroid isomerase-like protein
VPRWHETGPFCLANKGEKPDYPAVAEDLSSRCPFGGNTMAKPAPAKKSPEVAKVTAVNRAYYSALSARDMHDMEKVWSCAPDNMLTAPPVNPVTYVGWKAIRRHWEEYWPKFDEFGVSMKVNTVNINGPVAWVHGIETSHRRTTAGVVSKSRNYGTNIFVQQDGRWYMAFHQSAVIK